jgi:hypothetical protein
MRQHVPGAEMDIPANIEDAPFVKAIRAARMSIIIISSKDHGVLRRCWCGLEAFICTVVTAEGFLIDIYTSNEGEVHRFTDGLIKKDSGSALNKAGRE